jgi:hypothetical protein
MIGPKKSIRRDTPVESPADTPVESLEGFAMVPWTVVVDHRLEHVDIRIYSVLAACRRGPTAKLGRRLIAKYASTSQRRTKEAIERLISCGYVEAEQAFDGARTKYTLKSKWFGTGQTLAAPKAAKKPIEFRECPQCREDRPGLCKSGVCKSCNLRNKLRGIVREEVAAEFERTA